MHFDEDGSAGRTSSPPPRAQASTTLTDIAEFTDGILTWGRFNHPKLPTWAKAARIIFHAMLPSSAPSERVFSLVEDMFGRDQLKVLGDQLQGSVMFRLNKRTIG